MTDGSQGKRTPIKKRTYIEADDELIEKAEKAKQELKIYSNIELAKITQLSPSTINRFFQKKTIRPDSYNQICETLSLNEKIIVKEERTAFAISGSVEKKSIEKLKAIIDLLRKLTDGDLDCSGIELGSLKLILEGSKSGLEKLEELFQSGELNKKIAEQNLDITVENVSFRGTKFLGKPRIAVTIPGNYNQADIDTLKDELIDTSTNNIFKKIPPAQMLLLLLLFLLLAMPLIVEGIFPLIFQDTPKSENKNDLWYQLPFE